MRIAMLIIRLLQLVFSISVLVMGVIIINAFVRRGLSSYLSTVSYYRPIYAAILITLYLWMLITEARKRKPSTLTIFLIEFFALIASGVLIYLNTKSNQSLALGTILISAFLMVLSFVVVV
ncbi:hypothetical protein HK098_000683, partial [Nowakowskiella sp. JEL0407]